MKMESAVEVIEAIITALLGLMAHPETPRFLAR